MFEDDVFVRSINIAKYHVFAACLSDLAIHAVAQVTHNRQVPDDMRQMLALDCYRVAIRDNATEAPEEFSAQDSVDAFRKRLHETDWASGALGRENFTCSPQALLHWSPIAPELKRYDREIVENSIKFAWQDIRKQLRERLDVAATISDLSHRASASG
jgi:hypothetical protein